MAGMDFYRPGERILDITFAALRLRPAGPAGTIVPLTFGSAGVRRDVALRLRPYL
ncbi:hypothetical protein GOB93_02215 [Acetobacter musti]|uniref:Uncharacterized protein n=1 Tax=Acetobacter musti TaxID=864732 RepID=A0ABX0JP97_9PROT|nr:hypothetical protein [Acetobacter musti]NHN83454.1 hypothetical protein [Acetobacter musti]